MVASSDLIANWGALAAILFGGVAVWRDIRKQTIAGSLPTEYTLGLQSRIKDLEDNAVRDRKEREDYARKSRTYYYAAIQAHAKGEPPPPPPPDWP